MAKEWRASIRKESEMKTVTYSIPAINCMHCTHTIENEIGEMQGVRSVKADVATKKVAITFDAPADERKIRELLAEIEYPVAPEPA
jgi:copper chaperone CopZ